MGKGAAIAVHVVTRSSKNELVEINDEGSVKIRIKSAPVDGKANQSLIEFLGEIVGLPKSDIEIVSGLSARDKLVAFMNIDAPTLQVRLP